MKHTIAISTENIINTVLARSALRHHLKADRPPLLNRGQTDALRQIISGIFSSLAAQFAATPGPDDPDILSLTIEGDSVNPRAVASALERVIVTSLLAEAYADTDSSLSRFYESHSRSSLDTLQTLLASSATARITPTLF